MHENDTKRLLKMNLDIIVPVKNEVKSVNELTERIDAAFKAAHISYRIIFVNDHSTDGTLEALTDLSKRYPIHIIEKQGPTGKAYAVLEGSKHATSEFVALIDGDLQYPPELLPSLLEVARVKGVAVGNRAKRHTNPARKAVSAGFRYVFGNLLMNMNVDVQSGIKVFRREIIDTITHEEVTPWTLDMPLLVAAQDLGYEIGSVDMEFMERSHGESKVSLGRASLEIGAQAIKTRFRRKKIHKIHPSDPSESMKDAGLVHKRKRYITHTTLPHSRSAIKTFTGGQKFFIFAVIALLIGGFVLNPMTTAVIFIAILSVIYFLDVLFSTFVLLKSLHAPPEIQVTDAELAKLDDESLPVYSVLCPLYKEAHILPEFVSSMSALDWPKDKLEVLLLLEEDDKATIAAARKMNLAPFFKIVVVPHSLPKTKPKACNYGLSVATGEYIVIYDAEDKPDPLQLKKVFIAFEDLGPKYGCVQCKLNYFNPNHNLLTRLFTAEYSLWFDVVLPGLQSVDGVIPLGGTSNHFRRTDLMEFEAWDPFNVTEDCDLGVRLFKAGRKTAIVDSTTLEEANSNVRNWIRQRSRWIKGYFQTYLVHMRNPLQFFLKYRSQAFIFQLIIGMRMTFMLINPFLWIMTIAYFALNQYVGATIESLFPTVVFYLAGFALVVGNFIYLYNYMIGCAKRGHWGIIKFIFFVPFYWLLISVAAAMALWQLITKPHYWEKTNHGLHLKPVTPEEMEELESEVLEPALAHVHQQDLAPGVSQTYALQEKSKDTTEVETSPTVSTNHRNLLKGSAVLISASMIVSVINLLYSTYLGRNLGFAEFGVMSLLGSIINLVQIPLSAYSRAVTHKSALLYGKYGSPIKQFWVRVRGRVLLPTVVVVTLWLLVTPLMTGFFQTTSLLPFALITPIWGIGIFAAIDAGFLSGSHKFAIAALMTLSEAASKFLFTVLFITFGAQELVYAAIPFSLLISFVIGWIAVLFLKENPNISVEARDLKTISKKFLGSTLLIKLSTVVFLSVDVVLAKHFLSPEDAGRYALISLVGKMVYFLGALFSQFINPIVSRNVGAGESSRNVFLIVVPATALAATAGIIFFGVGAPLTLPFLLGDKVYEILPYILPYAVAYGAMTVATAIVNYHQSLQRHVFSLISMISAMYMLLLVSFFHANIQDIVLAVSVSGVAYLLITILFHFTMHTEGVLNRPSRILIFNWRDTKHEWAGGAEVYVHEIAKSWVKEGREVILFCGNDGKSARNEVIDGVQMIRRGGHYTVYLWAFIYYIFSLGNWCDIVVESENGIPFFSQLYSNKPVFLLVYHVHQDVFREHLPFPFSYIAMAIEKHLMPLIYRGGRVITISQSTKEDLVKLGLAEIEDIEIVNPGVDLAQYKTLTKTAHPSFIYIGRLKHYKNVDVAINAFAKVLVDYPTATLTIAGWGEMQPELAKLVSTLGITNSVRFAGKIDEYEKAVLLARSWVALQPSSVEGWGITVIEANAAGTPVIASRVAGLKDSVVDNVTGILVDVKNVDAWTDAMLRLIDNQDHRHKLANAAKEWSQKFSWHDAGLSFLNSIEKRISI